MRGQRTAKGGLRRGAGDGCGALGICKLPTCTYNQLCTDTLSSLHMFVLYFLLERAQQAANAARGPKRLARNTIPSSWHHPVGRRLYRLSHKSYQIKYPNIFHFIEVFKLFLLFLCFF